MILPLRQRHLRLVMVLGCFLPAVFALGIATRKSVPPTGNLPGPLTLAPQSFAEVGHPEAGWFAKVALQVGLLKQQGEPGQLAVKLSGGRDLAKPDLMVYWVAGNPNLAGTLPDNAVLLGTFGPSPLILPPPAAHTQGVLVLYSLANAEIVDVSKPLPLH
jgi:hypothetical protein